VHQRGLARRDPEEGRVEAVHIGDEAAEPGGLAYRRGVLGTTGLVVLPTVAGQLGDRVDAVHEGLPELTGRAHPAGEPAAHAHDRDGLVHAETVRRVRPAAIGLRSRPGWEP